MALSRIDWRWSLASAERTAANEASGPVCRSCFGSLSSMATPRGSSGSLLIGLWDLFALEEAKCGANDLAGGLITAGGNLAANEAAQLRGQRHVVGDPSWHGRACHAGLLASNCGTRGCAKFIQTV